jgi:Transcriptional regulator C-terminal region
MPSPGGSSNTTGFACLGHNEFPLPLEVTWKDVHSTMRFNLDVYFARQAKRSYFIRLFEHVAEHQQFYKLVLCGEGIGRFQKLVKDSIAEVAEAKMRELAPTNQKPTVPLAMHVQFLAGAVLSLLA